MEINRGAFKRARTPRLLKKKNKKTKKKQGKKSKKRKKKKTTIAIHSALCLCAQ